MKGLRIISGVSVAFLFGMTAVIATSCDSYKQSQGTGDAPIVRTEDEGWVVLNSPDQFPNIAFRCMGANGLYTARLADKDSARPITVVANDPQCVKR